MKAGRIGVVVGGGAALLRLMRLAVRTRARREAKPSVYIITGASSGFGRGVALRLAAERANIVLVARREDILRALADEIAKVGGTAMVAPADVTDSGALDAIAMAAAARFGRIDVWVNAAGIGTIGRFEDIPPEDQARVVDTNLNGVIFGSGAALRVFRQQRRGTLINVGSIDSELPIAYQATYAATKAAVLSLGKSLNEEARLGGFREIFVSTIMPWASDTPWWLHASNYSGRVPSMVAIDPPDGVVKAIVRNAKRPRAEVVVGWKATAAHWGHRIAPRLTERMASNVAHRAQMVSSPLAPATHGALFTPVEEGTGVDGAWRAGLRAARERSSGFDGRLGLPFREDGDAPTQGPSPMARQPPDA